MIAAALITWGVAAVAVGVAFSCTATAVKRGPSEPDFLWDQPTDVLSDAAVDARFDEIVAHFRVLS